MTMTMNRILMHLIGTAVLAALTAVPAQAMVQREYALASALSDGSPLYREEHLVRRSDGRLDDRLVLYRCLDGSAFARKRVRYGDDPAAPSFQLEDARSGYREGAERTDEGLRVAWTAPGKAEAAALLPPGPLVADAGFDEWVRAAWDPLTRGQPQSMQFLVPSRLRAYRFEVSPVDSDDPSLRAFQLRLGGWLGWLAPSIYVAYDAQTRRLVRFEGLSNLRDDAGDAPLKVRIEFPDSPRQVESVTFDRALDEPLVACRVQSP
jgi:hypothetical protein